MKLYSLKISIEIVGQRHNFCSFLNEQMAFGGFDRLCPSSTPPLASAVVLRTRKDAEAAKENHFIHTYFVKGFKYHSGQMV